MLDIYFRSEYGKLYEEIEGGVCETYVYNEGDVLIQNMYIKRPISWLIDGIQYFDIITPYGYGGPIVVSGEATPEILGRYFESWSKNCTEHGIICEFVRFHPLENNWKIAKGYMDVSLCRNTIAIDLCDNDYFLTQYTSSCRNKIKKAIKNGITLEVDSPANAIDKFVELYSKTMEKNHATNYYYFPNRYFEKMFESFPNQGILFHAKYQGKIISSSWVLIGDEFMHYHLTANDPEYYKLAANNALLNEIVEYGNKLGKKWLHLGGGLSMQADDALYTYKSSFGRTEKNVKEFYIGKKIFNQEVYNKLVSIRQIESVPPVEGYFPLYRG